MRGATVSLDVCNSTFDTKLWVGTGCPGDSAATFGCTPESANDDAPGCGPTNFGSRVTFGPPAGTRVLYAVVGGILGGGPMAYTLRWRVGGASWLTASATITSSGTLTGTRTATHTPTTSRTPTRSRSQSRKAK